MSSYNVTGHKADALSGSNTGDGTNDMKRSVTFAGSYSTPSSENTVPERVEGTGSILRGKLIFLLTLISANYKHLKHFCA